MDLNFHGPRLTWRNGRIQERLDWVVVNYSWFAHFKDAYIEHISWLKSDHRPILLRLGTEGNEDRPPQRFRFITAWATDCSFKDLIKNNWCNEDDWLNARECLTEKIKKWNNTCLATSMRGKDR